MSELIKKIKESRHDIFFIIQLGRKIKLNLQSSDGTRMTQ